MFYRDKNGWLNFNSIDFEFLIDDIICDAEPKNMGELKWMTSRMIDIIQMCACQHVRDNDHFECDWEDVYCPC